MDMGHGFREGVEYFNITFFGDVEILHGWVPRRIVSAHRTKRRHYFLEGNVQSRAKSLFGNATRGTVWYTVRYEYDLSKRPL